MMKAEWYQEEIAKLRAIVDKDVDPPEESDEGYMIAREYIAEKLDRILSGTGIGIHPTLEPVKDYILKKLE